MTEFVCSGDQIHAIGNHGRSCGMTKCVGMNVREVMFLAEFAQPIGDTVRVQPASVILCEDVAAIYPPVSLGKLHAKLFRFPFAEQFKTLGRKANGPRTAGFGFAFIHTF